MAEDRRLKIARRQLMMAQIARREACYALANALGEEERSGQIHDRARSLLYEYEKRVAATNAGVLSHALQSNLAFVRTLQSMAEDAEQAHRDASDQARWQTQALARAETRLDAHETRVREEKHVLHNRREQRELTDQLVAGPDAKKNDRTSMARKLQNQRHTGDGDVQNGTQETGSTQP